MAFSMTIMRTGVRTNSPESPSHVTPGCLATSKGSKIH